MRFEWLSHPECYTVERVAIARALVTAPTLLLADEPTGALDSQTGKEILALFQWLNEMGNTIIMITHDLSVAQHSKRIARLVDGVLSFQDKEEQASQLLPLL